MKLIFRSYLASLKEREELDAILPDLLSELGYTVFSRPGRGTLQFGVDVAAVGQDEDGQRKVFLFSVKQGNITRQSWNDGTLQSVRRSLDDILDAYIPTRIPKRFSNLDIVICLAFGGDIQEAVRTQLSNYPADRTTAFGKRISLDEWNGDKLADLLVKGILREKSVPREFQPNFQKAIALVDEPDAAYRYFRRMLAQVVNERKRFKEILRAARQLYIGLWVIYVWARDAHNVEVAYRASELVLLNIWNLAQKVPATKSGKERNQCLELVQQTVSLHQSIATEFLATKVLPYVKIHYGVSSALGTREAADVNLKLFELLGRIGIAGLWAQWSAKKALDHSNSADSNTLSSREIAEMGFALICHNPALLLPLQDQHAIDIALFLLLAAGEKEYWNQIGAWLREMTLRLEFAVKIHSSYPCVFTDYRDLISHPREQTDKYRARATTGSILIPLLSAFLAAVGDRASLMKLLGLMNVELRGCPDFS